MPPDFDIISMLRSFPKLTAAGPSGMRVQHLLDAASVPLPTPIFTSLRHVVNVLAAVKAPSGLAIFLSGASLTALSKNKQFYIHPIAVIEVLRRITRKCLRYLIRVKAADFFQPLQLGVACPQGVEKIFQHLQSCIEDHCSDKHFVVLKVDMTNAFNLVSRQAFLDDCAQHFPELLAWTSWCYNQHPLLWHQLGILTSQVEVQQGDPLDPFLFALVLQRIVNVIYTDEECVDLSHNAWYLDDGSLAGKSVFVLRALSIVSSQGPALGFNINLKKSV